VIGTRSPPPDGPERSPAMLAPPPRRGAGVRRLNRMPLVIGFGGACVVAAAIGHTYHERAMQAAANAQRDAERKAEPASGASILNGAPASGEVRSAVYRPMPPHGGTPIGGNCPRVCRERRRLPLARRAHHKATVTASIIRKYT
jgi:type IV secretion system protein VirB10